MEEHFVFPPDARAHDQSRRQKTALLQTEIRKAVKRSVLAGSSFDRKCEVGVMTTDQVRQRPYSRRASHHEEPKVRTCVGHRPNVYVALKFECLSTMTALSFSRADKPWRYWVRNSSLVSKEPLQKILYLKYFVRSVAHRYKSSFVYYFTVVVPPA